MHTYIHNIHSIIHIRTNRQINKTTAATMRIAPTSTPTTMPTMAPVDRPSSDSVAPAVELTDGVTGEVVGKTVEVGDGVMITLDTTMTSTEGKLHNTSSLANNSQINYVLTYYNETSHVVITLHKCYSQKQELLQLQAIYTYDIL